MLANLLSALSLSSKSRREGHRAARRSQTRQVFLRTTPRYEVLESRELMAAQLVDGVLTITAAPTGSYAMVANHVVTRKSDSKGGSLLSDFGFLVNDMTNCKESATTTISSATTVTTCSTAALVLI